MKNLIYILIIIAISSCNGLGQNRKANEVKKEFIADFYDKAYYVKMKYDVPICVTLAVCAFETGWNQSPLSRKKNNMFGLMKYCGTDTTYNDTIMIVKPCLKPRTFRTKFDSFEYFGSLIRFSKTYKKTQGLPKIRRMQKLQAVLYRTRQNILPWLP